MSHLKVLYSDIYNIVYIKFGYKRWKIDITYLKRGHEHNLRFQEILYFQYFPAISLRELWPVRPNA